MIQSIAYLQFYRDDEPVNRITRMKQRKVIVSINTRLLDKIDLDVRIARLPEKYRRVIELLYIDRMPPADVVKVLKISRATMYRRSSKAKGLLR